MLTGFSLAPLGRWTLLACLLLASGPPARALCVGPGPVGPGPVEPGPVEPGHAPAADEPSPRVRWKGRSVELSKLPEELSDARQAVLAWSGWAQEHEYGLELSSDGVVLLVVPEGSGSNKARMKLVERAIEFVDERLPLPADARDLTRADSPVTTPARGSDPAAIPEDPEEGGSPFEDAPRDAASARATWAWGAGTRPLDTGSVTMFVLRGSKDYAAVLAALASAAPSLAGWADQARSINGFAIFEPLAGAMLLEAPGMEEWAPEAELLHRVATLLLARRFGQQPHWLSTGFSWYAELELRGGIYCYPWRQGFVGIGEHGGWGASLRKRYRDTAFEPEDLTALQRGSFNDAAAGVAWGVATYLMERHQQAVPELLVRYYRTWDQGSRIALGGYSWRRDTQWAMSPEDQFALLVEVLGAEVPDELQEFLASGCKP